MKFYDYQSRFYKDPSRFRIYNKARQIGVSFEIGYEAAINAFAKRKDSLLASASLRQSTELNHKCRLMIKAMSKISPYVRLEGDSRSELKLAGGGRIFTLPSNPKTVRGFTGDVYLDEFALHKGQRDIYKALLPTITRGHRISIISTPLGQSDLFHEIFTEPNKYPDFSRHQTNIYDAKEQGFDIDIDLIKRNIDDEGFRQEYMCEFIDEATSYFPYDLIRPCLGDIIVEGESFLGVDVGRLRDLTAIYVITRAGDKYYYKRHEILEKYPYSDQLDIIRQIIREENITRGAVDATGIGSQMAEDLHNEFYFIEPVTFTNKIKEELVTSMRKIFETQNIMLPDDRDLITDIHAIKRTVTSAGNVRFDAARTNKGHSDRFWAVALALHAGKEVGAIIDSASVY